MNIDYGSLGSAKFIFPKKDSHFSDKKEAHAGERMKISGQAALYMEGTLPDNNMKL